MHPLFFEAVPEWKLKQIVDAQQLYSGYRSAVQEAEKYRGRLNWEKANGAQYLVSTRYDGGVRQRKSLGPRNDQTEEIARLYTERASAVRERRAALAEHMDRQVRINRALRLGIVPPNITRVLALIDKAGTAKHALVLGANAMFAYAYAASVTFAESILPSGVEDPLRDSRSLLRIATCDPEGLHRIVQRRLPSFARVAGAPSLLLNHDGFGVEVIRRDAGYLPSGVGLH